MKRPRARWRTMTATTADTMFVPIVAVCKKRGNLSTQSSNLSHLAQKPLKKEGLCCKEGANGKDEDEDRVEKNSLQHRPIRLWILEIFEGYLAMDSAGFKRRSQTCWFWWVRLREGCNFWVHLLAHKLGAKVPRCLHIKTYVCKAPW